MKKYKPSGTARLIARSVIYLNANPATAALIPMGSVEYCRLFLGSEKISSFEIRCRKPWFQKLLHKCEGWTVPGLPIHFALRKRYIEQVVRESISDGYSQIVILGAGFDTLALRLHKEFPTCKFIEVDHPATQQAKLNVLSKADLESNNLTFIQADLSQSQDIERVLTQEDAISLNADTIFVAEGLFMYLADSDVINILRFARRKNARTRIAFTFMQPGKDTLAAFERQSFLVYLWLRHEPFQWGIPRNQLPEFLAKVAMIQENVMTPQDLQKQSADLVPKSYRPNGDLVAVASYSKEA